MKKVCLVSAVHIQPSQQWIKALPDIPVFIVDDSDGQISFTRENIEVFDYKRQKQELGKNYDFFAKTFHKSSACKNFGLWYAYRQGYDYIIIIDSDCICPPNFVKQHLVALEKKGNGWENNMTEFEKGNCFARGYPYSERNKKVVLNMGMWRGQMDINGQDKIDNPELAKMHDDEWFPVAITKTANGIIPLSGMNFIIKREAIPAFLLIPNFDYEDLKFRRCDDIFGGYIFQKIVKLKGDCISYGQPLVYHDSEVNPEEDAKEEEAMNKYDSEFYKKVDEIVNSLIQDRDYKDIFGEFVEVVKTKLIGTKFESLMESFNWFKKLYV